MEPEVDFRNFLLRKSSRAQMLAGDEGHAEPFEIIESTQFKNRIRRASPPINDKVKISQSRSYFESMKTEKNAQISKNLDKENIDMQENNTDLEYIKPSQCNMYSLVNRLKKMNIPRRRQKTNFIAQNIRNISQYREKKVKSTKYTDVRTSKYSNIHNENRIRTTRSKEGRLSQFTNYSKGISSHRNSYDPQVELKFSNYKTLDPRHTLMINTQSAGDIKQDMHLTSS